MTYALITGASEGIGRAFAEIAAGAGLAHAVEAVVLPGDLSEAGAAERLWSKAAEGRQIDFLINNAGFGHAGAFGGDIAKEQAMIQLNVAAAAELAARAGTHMREHGERSRILHVASVAAFLPGPNMALCPGPVATGFQAAADMGGTAVVTKMQSQMATAEEVARAGWAGAITGDAIVVPGAMNKATAFASRLMPRGVYGRIVGKFYEKD